MKGRLSFLLLLLAVPGLLTAEAVRLFPGDNSVTVISNTNAETVLKFTVTCFVKDPVTIGTETWYHVWLPREGVSLSRGDPQLPVFNRSIIIPDHSLLRLQILDAEYQDLELPVAPSKGVITRDQDPTTVPYSFGAAYKKDAFFPDSLASLSDPYILRDFRGLTVQTMPFAYNPVSKTLRVFTSYTLRIYTDGLDSRNAFNRQREEISLTFVPVYENHFLNWQSFRYTPVSDNYGKLLVVCHSNFMSAIQPYVNWKRQKGIETELVEWSAIGSTAAQLQTYLQNRYNADPELTFVQIVGDAPQIPSLTSGGGGADPMFSLVAGADNYPDIFIGRFSAETAEQVTAQTNKAIAYERDLGTSATWLSRAMGLASAEGGGSQGDMGESDSQHMNLIRTDLLNYGYTSVDQIYDPGALASTVTANINAGRGFVNYVGHGSNTSWGTTGFNNTNASALTNGNMAPIIQDVACVNGNFVSLTCFAEAWLRNANGGAVAMYASSINQSWNSPMRAQDETVDLLVAETKTTAGGLFYNGSCKMMDIYGNTTGSDGVNMFRTWHIFGDASLQVRSKTPLAMMVSHPAQIVIGSTSLSVATGVANALVSLTYDNFIYARGFTDAAGNLTLTMVNPPATELTYTLTATAFNRVSYIGSVQQVTGGGPNLSVASVIYSDANNDVPEYNDSGSLNVTFQNSGSDAASNVSTTLSCSTPGITITDNSESIACLAAGSFLSVADAYSFSIAPGIADGTNAAFTIAMSCGGNNWNHDFLLAVHAPVLAFGAMSVSDPAPANGNGRLDPGESVTISIALNNTGGAQSPSGNASLSSSTPGITVNTASVGFSLIAAAGSANLSFSVTAAAGISNGTLAIFIFAATAGAYSCNYAQQVGVGSLPDVILGSGTSSNGTSTACPVNEYLRSLHGQSVYTAAELNSAGITGPLEITRIGFNITGLPNYAMPNFVVRMGHTTATDASGWTAASGLATVYSASSYQPAETGWNMLTLSTAFTWNGVNNLVIDTAFNLTSASSSSGTTQYTNITNGYRYTRSSYSNQTNVFYGGSTLSYRPNVRLVFADPLTGPLIEVSPTELNFGAIIVGNCGTLSFSIRNDGDETLSGSIATPECYSVASGTKGTRNFLDYSIPALSCQVFDLTFTPASAISYNCNLSISSNDAAHPTQYIALRGSGSSPCMYGCFKAFLEGPYVAGGSMNHNIGTVLPLTSPYNANHSVSALPDPSPRQIVDWVYLELRSTADGPTEQARSAFLLDDGTVADLEGNTTLAFEYENTTSYYVILRHRNHLGAMSAVPYTFSLTPGSAPLIDLSALGSVYGGNQTGVKQVEAGVLALISGDADADGCVLPTDLNLYWRVQTGLSGYRSADFNRDGTVLPSDLNLFWRVNVGMQSQIPGQRTMRRP